MESRKAPVPKIHTVQIDQRNHAVVMGVNDVSSFHETEVVLKVDSGTLFVTGQNLHIEKLLLDEGRVDVDGHIDGVIYEIKREKTRLLRWPSSK